MHTTRSRDHHAQPTLRRLFLILALLTGMCLPIASTAHAAASGGIPPNGPCYWNLCLYEESSQSLTAWSLWDVGPTPYYISIFNQTTGARLKMCSTGSSCTTPPYIPFGKCYTYVAFIGGSGASLPPNPVQRTSSTLTKCNIVP